MAVDKFIDSGQLNAALLATANAIREKGGTSDAISFNATTGFAAAISDMSAGGSDISDTTATADDVMSGKYFYTADGQKTQGTLVPADGVSF